MMAFDNDAAKLKFDQIDIEISKRRAEIQVLQEAKALLRQTLDVESQDRDGNPIRETPKDRRTDADFVDAEREKILDTVTIRVAPLITIPGSLP